MRCRRARSLIIADAGLLAVALEVLGAATPVLADPNNDTCLVLHAVPGLYITCQIDDPCNRPGGPSVAISASGIHTVYVMLRNHDNVVYLQCAFEWPDNWNFAFGLWNCPPGGWLCEGFPSAPGPYLGSYACGFNCLTGGATAVIGLMIFNSPHEGCLEIIESAYPGGTFVLACDVETGDPIDPRNRGRVCVGAGGRDACTSATPVDPGTWGSIKASYQPGLGTR